MNYIIHHRSSFFLVLLIGLLLYSCNDSLDPLEGIDLKKPADITLEAELTVSKENPDGPLSREGSSKLIDGGKQTKFLIFGYTSDFWAQQAFEEAVTINAYTMTAGNDAPDRDPINWVLEGSNDSTSWETIHTVTDAQFPIRNKTNIYRLDEEVTYRYFRLSITANAGSDLLQISEWRLLYYGGGQDTSSVEP